MSDSDAQGIAQALLKHVPEQCMRLLNRAMHVRTHATNRETTYVSLETYVSNVRRGAGENWPNVGERWPVLRTARTEKRREIPQGDRIFVYARDGFCCCFCGRSGKEWERDRVQLVLDHVIPWSALGSDHVNSRSLSGMPPPGGRETLAVVVGQNCKRIRNQIGITQDELARYARSCGLRWRASTVADFEGARSAPTFATVLTVSLALQNAAQTAAANGSDILMEIATLDRLVQFDGMIEINDDVALTADTVIALCRGQTREGYRPPPGIETEDSLRFQRELWGDGALTSVKQVQLRSGSTEERLARQLHIERYRLAELSYLLWKSTFSEERDRRAGPSANQQKKGRITREMRAEIETELANGDG